MSDLLMHRSAKLSDCGHFRWTLDRFWDIAGPRGFVCMHNPSIADAFGDDQTILRLNDWFYRWGFGGYTVGNLLPIRTSQPTDALHWLRNSGLDCDAIATNDAHLRNAVDGAQLIIVAWGAIHAVVQPRVRPIATILRSARSPICCLGRTAMGFPTHPMARGKHRLPRELTPLAWDFS
jgi:hypothetical protein